MKKTQWLGIWVAAMAVGSLGYGPATAQGQALVWEEAVAGKIPESHQLVQLGKRIYEKACFYCHGKTGDGKGMAERYLAAKPRVFEDGQFKIRTTPTGSLPTDLDLFRTITVGFPEYGMPRFGYLASKERWALVYYIKTFSSVFKEEKPEKPLDIGKEPSSDEASVDRGKKVFERMKCWECHGHEGKGDGPKSDTLKDRWGNPSRVMNFTLDERFYKRGARARDVVYSLMTGLSGTPMPSYEDSITLEEAWDLARFVERWPRRIE